MKIGNLELGSGIPKICVPLASPTLDGLLAEAARAKAEGADIAEWRADLFGGGVAGTAAWLRQALGDMPLLFTYRTENEGGKGKAGAKEYLAVNREAIAAGAADLIDIELSSGDDICLELIVLARQSKTASILSSHDFSRTPPPGDMLAVMKKAIELGGDVPKLAVTPNSPADVLALLEATELFAREYPEQPAITVSMGALGVISRVSGGFFGSAITFASLDSATAPGQLPLGDLRRALDILHSAG